VESEASELREPAWARTLFAGLTVLGRREIEIETSRKGADWKVALARYLRERHLPPGRWFGAGRQVNPATGCRLAWALRSRVGSAARSLVRG